jgi:hypothetical protein
VITATAVKPGVLDQHPKTIAHVLQCVFQPAPSPHVPTLLSQSDFVPNSPVRRVPRFFRRNAGFDLFLLPQFAVQAHLFFQVAVELTAAKQHQEPSSEFNEPVHGSLSLRRSE